MSMRTLESLRDMLCEELDHIAGQGELNVGALDIIDKLVHSIKNIDKIIMSEGNSHMGDWEGNSYRRGRDSMGRYSRRGYSRSSETDNAIGQLEQMLEEAGGESEHAAIKKAISLLRNA